MTKCDGCNHKRKIRKYKRDDYLSKCKVDWSKVGMTRKHCPCKECIVKVTCTKYCDVLSNFYYDRVPQYVKSPKKV